MFYMHDMIYHTRTCTRAHVAVLYAGATYTLACFAQAPAFVTSDSLALSARVD